MGCVQGPDETGRRQPRLGDQGPRRATSATSARRPRRRASAGTPTSSGRGTWSSSIRTAPTVGGCDATSPQGRWLAADLAASTATCTLAIWHHPRFSSGFHGNDPEVGPFWEALYAAGADVVINGHDHDYERFAPQTPDAHERPGARHPRVRRRDRRRGARGRSRPAAANSQLRLATSHGIIRFDLRQDSYDWTFMPTTGSRDRFREGPVSLTDQARVVVIGGGITGCSVAYHLALAGWTDVLLVEKAQLTAGSTCQAAGLVTAFNPSSTMMGFRRYSIELYRSLGAFETVGSLRLASSPEQLRELERTASRARGIGLDAGVIGPDEARRLMPAISPDVAVRRGPPRRRRPPRPARRDPRGGRCRPRAGRPDPDRGPRDRVRAVGPARDHGRPDRRRPDRHRARRQRRRHLGAAGRGDGRRVHPVDPGRPPAHRAQGRARRRSCPRDMPCFRDPDNLVYGKSEHGGMVFGGYELDPRLALGGRRAVGPRGAVAAARLRALRAADGRARSGASRSWPTRRRSGSSATPTR